eukprot:scaffold1440_cov332-Pavlova_lutheri.AAC.13
MPALVETDTGFRQSQPRTGNNGILRIRHLLYTPLNHHAASAAANISMQGPQREGLDPGFCTFMLPARETFAWHLCLNMHVPVPLSRTTSLHRTSPSFSAASGASVICPCQPDSHALATALLLRCTRLAHLLL